MNSTASHLTAVFQLNPDYLVPSSFLLHLFQTKTFVARFSIRPDVLPVTEGNKQQRSQPVIWSHPVFIPRRNPDGTNAAPFTLAL